MALSQGNFPPHATPGHHIYHYCSAITWHSASCIDIPKKRFHHQRLLEPLHWTNKMFLYYKNLFLMLYYALQNSNWWYTEWNVSQNMWLRNKIQWTKSLHTSLKKISNSMENSLRNAVGSTNQDRWEIRIGPQKSVGSMQNFPKQDTTLALRFQNGH